MQVRVRLMLTRKVLLLCGLMGVSLGGWAQTNTGRLLGTVYDQSGALVSGASVVVVDTATRRERNAQSAADGTFVQIGRAHV